VSGPARVAAFSVALVALFAGAALLGGAVDPSGSQAGEDHGAGHAGGEQMAADAHGSDEHGEGAPGESAAAPPGLQVAEDGYRLIAGRTRFARAQRSAQFAFRIVDGDGEPVRDFELEHEKRMHFIVVRRDLRGFQHLHPTMRPDGTWSTSVDFVPGGVYRVFADFKAGGTKRTLGTDVHVGGRYRPEPLPGSEQSARTEDGLEVSLRSDEARAGEEGRVEFEVRDGAQVVNDDLQTYLGAAGHLVALRAGDLAYLHTHPEGDELAFMADYPSAGSYRLFVQFRYRGRLQTAAFTQEVPR